MIIVHLDSRMHCAGLTPSIDNYINTNYNEQPEGVDAALKSFNTIINTAAIQSK